MKGTFISKKLAKRLHSWVLVSFIATLFLISYLAGSNEYIAVHTAWTIFFILAAIMLVASAIFMLTLDKKERNHAIISLSLQAIVYTPVFIYYIFIKD